MPSFESMRTPVEPLTPGRLRGAADVLVRAWQEDGHRPEDYDLVWRAKEYLRDLADIAEREAG